MKSTVAALSMLLVSGAAGATGALAQPAGRPGASIPAQFHGRWAENQRACRPQHFTSVITIDARGWSSFEEGGQVTRTGQVRRGTHYFRVDNHASAEETTGSLALRREGPRLIMTFDDDSAPPVHYTLIRCR
jgi:hypothetical protein